MIVLRICALGALLAPVSLAGAILSLGDGTPILANMHILTLVCAEIAAIGTLVCAWKYRRQANRIWPNRNTIVAAILSVFAPFPDVKYFLRWFDASSPIRLIGWPLFIPILVVAVQILRAPTGKTFHPSRFAEFKEPKTL